MATMKCYYRELLTKENVQCIFSNIEIVVRMYLVLIVFRRSSVVEKDNFQK